MAEGSILVVDNDRATATYIRDALEMVGYTVRGAVDGAGLEAACKDHPRVILLDINSTNGPLVPAYDGLREAQRDVNRLNKERSSERGEP